MHVFVKQSWPADGQRVVVALPGHDLLAARVDVPLPDRRELAINNPKDLLESRAAHQLRASLEDLVRA
jgi:hypothetical protein